MGYQRHTAHDDVLTSPGERDITAHVNFTMLQEAGSACGLRTQRFETLAQTLLAAGEADQFAAALGRGRRGGGVCGAGCSSRRCCSGWGRRSGCCCNGGREPEERALKNEKAPEHRAENEKGPGTPGPWSRTCLQPFSGRAQATSFSSEQLSRPPPRAGPGGAHRVEDDRLPLPPVACLPGAPTAGPSSRWAGTRPRAWPAARPFSVSRSATTPPSP